MTDATSTFIKAAQGDRAAIHELTPVMYGELHNLAEAYLARERAGHTLQPTALLHEAYVKLVDQKAVHVNDRTHFFALAAQSMRHVLVDHARRRNADKRGGGRARQALEAVLPVDLAGNPGNGDVLALHEALEALEKINPLTVRITEMRFFGGMTVEEIALALNTSISSVEREWRFARAWLRDRLGSAN